jgi:hypothetical protein
MDKSDQDHLRMCYPFEIEGATKKLELCAEVRKSDGHQQILMVADDEVIEKLSCIHTVVCEIPVEEFTEEKRAEIAKEWAKSAKSSEGLQVIDIDIDEKYKALKSWTQGIAESGEMALDFEGIYNYGNAAIERSLQTFIAKVIDKDWLMERIFNTKHRPTLIANLKKMKYGMPKKFTELALTLETNSIPRKCDNIYSFNNFEDIIGCHDAAEFFSISPYVGDVDTLVKHISRDKFKSVKLVDVGRFDDTFNQWKDDGIVVIGNKQKYDNTFIDRNIDVLYSYYDSYKYGSWLKEFVKTYKIIPTYIQESNDYIYFDEKQYKYGAISKPETIIEMGKRSNRDFIEDSWKIYLEQNSFDTFLKDDLIKDEFWRSSLGAKMRIDFVDDDLAYDQFVQELKESIDFKKYIDFDAAVDYNTLGWGLREACEELTSGYNCKHLPENDVYYLNM